MNLDLRGKRALVCGSTQGIGKAVALELALLGASVTLVARNESQLNTVASELSRLFNQQHEYLVADFNDPARLRDLIHDYVSAKAIHILVNNTGGPPGGPITEASTEAFLSAFSNHLVCNHILAQAVIPGMRLAGYGRIVNIISTSVKQPLKNLGVSNTIRAAVANWSKTLSGEVAVHGITVNNVLPGATNTIRLQSLIEAKAQKTGHPIESVRQEMIEEVPMHRFAEASEIANAVAFLTSPAASYITGINVPVDGGRTSSL
ncbi:MAG: SDR family oxidoreductase [Bacteroidota bacterium]